MRSRSTPPRAILAFDASDERLLFRHKPENDVMPDSTKKATLSSLPSVPGRTERSHKGLCAALLGATMLAALPGAAVTPAAAQPAQKPNILFIMVDDIGWMQPSIYHRGLMVGETPNIDRIGNEGAIFMTYYAEQSCTAGRNAFSTGMNP